ncbi:hypothetical protein [Desulforhopalus singaporensis]|uniref:hypothetical protein n=1 Tax=Desulforhopalus singaporensis TaxID=91360 RepID=UPI000B84256A|nr:hypothetical protein [Desulforhopalus singaporensis]
MVIRFAGIDIGSRTIELVMVDEMGQVTARCQALTGFDPMKNAKKLVDEICVDRKEIARGLHMSAFR